MITTAEKDSFKERREAREGKLLTRDAGYSVMLKGDMLCFLGSVEIALNFQQAMTPVGYVTMPKLISVTIKAR